MLYASKKKKRTIGKKKRNNIHKKAAYNTNTDTLTRGKHEEK